MPAKTVRAHDSVCLGASASVLAQKYFSLLVILRERNDRRISTVANGILRFAQNDVIRATSWCTRQELCKTWVGSVFNVLTSTH